MSHPQPSARVSTGMGGCAGKAAGRCSASCAVDADAAALSGAGKAAVITAGIPGGAGEDSAEADSGATTSCRIPSSRSAVRHAKKTARPTCFTALPPFCRKTKFVPCTNDSFRMGTHNYTASFPFRQCNKRTFPGRIRKNPLSRTKNAQFEHFRRFCPLALARQM